MPKWWDASAAKTLSALRSSAALETGVRAIERRERGETGKRGRSEGWAAFYPDSERERVIKPKSV